MSQPNTNVYDKKTKLLINAPLNWKQLNLSKEAKSVAYDTDEEGNVTKSAITPILYPLGMSGQTEVQVTPLFFKTGVINAASNSTTVWTPATGKKFRLLGYTIDVSNDCAEAAADQTIFVEDQATTIFTHCALIPAVSVATVCGGKTIALTLPANGYLSTKPGNTLIVAIGGNLTAGKISVNAWGTEE